MSGTVDPNEAALRWLHLYRDLGVESLPPRARTSESSSSTTVGGQGAVTPSFSGDDAGALNALLSRGLDPANTLGELQSEIIGDCRRCRLCEGRTKLVFGVGAPRARLMFVGEGPGADEDQQGEPFVGRAGQLLDKIIAAMGLARGDVYIANVVKCRPPENRTPLPDEVSSCLPFLFAQIATIKPEVIVALGRSALEALTGYDGEGITKLRGRWFEHASIPVMATFHPAYLLRNPAAKKPVWDDMQSVMSRLDLPPKS